MSITPLPPPTHTSIDSQPPQKCPKHTCTHPTHFAHHLGPCHTRYPLEPVPTWTPALFLALLECARGYLGLNNHNLGYMGQYLSARRVVGTPLTMESLQGRVESTTHVTHWDMGPTNSSDIQVPVKTYPIGYLAPPPPAFCPLMTCYKDPTSPHTRTKGYHKTSHTALELYS
ncbi:hypothetical protein G9A89_000349 [Geosiphon pyriformis]|nr:hypothetical protein G9A89_000349 [Geosiphon pyriformis]